MGFVRAYILLVNAVDEINAKQGLIKPEEVRKVEVLALVDTGASTLVINDEIKEKLGLTTDEYTMGTLADGATPKVEKTSPIKIYFKNRTAVCSAMVMPKSQNILLGVLPIEEMDVIADTNIQELVLPPGREDHALVLL
ncbi:MAG: aspartyl protease family protein [Planctomycetaceae bacterium]|jgi:clan AA aspartic protease|nr:aspartyl protease family protein [Planctomycetaceae bacterium]